MILGAYKLVALMEQSSNQILIDLQNIYTFKDIIEFSGDKTAMHLENIDTIP